MKSYQSLAALAAQFRSTERHVRLRAARPKLGLLLLHPSSRHKFFCCPLRLRNPSGGLLSRPRQNVFRRPPPHGHGQPIHPLTELPPPGTTTHIPAEWWFVAERGPTSTTTRPVDINILVPPPTDTPPQEEAAADLTTEPAAPAELPTEGAPADLSRQTASPTAQPPGQRRVLGDLPVVWETRIGTVVRDAPSKMIVPEKDFLRPTTHPRYLPLPLPLLLRIGRPG